MKIHGERARRGCPVETGLFALFATFNLLTVQEHKEIIGREGVLVSQPAKNSSLLTLTCGPELLLLQRL
jgi:hypothetical protein